MKSFVLTRLRGALLATGLLFAASIETIAALPSITFSHVDGRVTSVSFDSFQFTLSKAYLSSQLQIRIFDLYAGAGTIDTGNTYTGFSIQKNAEAVVSNHGAIMTPWNTTLGGNSTDGDMITWINIPFTLATSDTFTFSGTGIAENDPTKQILVPTSGTYAVHLISGQDGSSLATPIMANIVGVAAVPEPSTYAAIAAGMVLTFAIYRRRRQAE